MNPPFRLQRSFLWSGVATLSLSHLLIRILLVTASNKQLKTLNGGFNCSSISVSLSSQVDKSIGTSLEGVTLHTERSDSLPNSDRRRNFKKQWPLQWRYFCIPNFHTISTSSNSLPRITDTNMPTLFRTLSIFWNIFYTKGLRKSLHSLPNGTERRVRVSFNLTWDTFKRNLICRS